MSRTVIALQPTASFISFSSEKYPKNPKTRLNVRTLASILYALTLSVTLSFETDVRECLKFHVCANTVSNCTVFLHRSLFSVLLFVHKCGTRCAQYTILPMCIHISFFCPFSPISVERILLNQHCDTTHILYTIAVRCAATTTKSDQILN